MVTMAACGSGNSGAAEPAGSTGDSITSAPIDGPTGGTAPMPPTTAIVATADQPSSAPPEAEPPGSSPDRPLPLTAAAAAADLAEVEAAIRDPSISHDEAAAWGRRQQLLYRVLANNPDWVDEALSIDDPVLRSAVERNWEARVALEKLVMSHGPEEELPAWRVVEPRPVDELLGYYRDGEAQWGIDWPYLAAINLIETRMGRIEGLSSAGAVGPMQFLPTTWAECCDGDATNPADAIPGAARYLTIRGGPENMERAIWGYNNSDHYVAAVTSYAAVMAEDELAYRGYHAWEIFFLSTEGLIHIPVGYDQPEPVPIADWIAAHPDTLLSNP